MSSELYWANERLCSIVADGRHLRDEDEISHMCDAIKAAMARDDAAEKLVEAVRFFQEAGCPNCSGDCASANPPVQFCPMKSASDALAAYEKSKALEPVKAGLRPISTAPDDGSQIIVALRVYGSDEHPTHAKKYLRTEYAIAETGPDSAPWVEHDTGWSDLDWTHWSPLPEALEP